MNSILILCYHIIAQLQILFCEREKKMELLQLKYFCHAAECENFSKTAEHYGVPTSNISSSVRRLETELDTKLFSRYANKLKLNENGRKFYTHVRNAINEIETAVNSVNETDDQPHGELRVLLSSCRRIATEAVELFQKKYPDVRFHVRHGTSDEEFDIIISDAPPSKGEYDKIKLLSERILLAIPESSPLYSLETPQEHLENERFLSLGEGTWLHALTIQLCNSLGFKPNVAVQTDDPYYMRKYLEAGFGVAFFPERSWAQLIPKGVRLVDVSAPMRNIFMFTPKNRKKTQAQKVFMELIIAGFSDSEKQTKSN